MPKGKREGMGARGAIRKTAVVCTKDRANKQVAGKVVPTSMVRKLCEFVPEDINSGATVCTDEAPAYDTLLNRKTIWHSLMDCVKNQIHTNSVESFWSMLKWAQMGTFHKIPTGHLHRNVAGLADCQNTREQDTLNRMALIADRMVGRRLRDRKFVK